MNIMSTSTLRTEHSNSESANKAAVHCVIIGFSCVDRKVKTLFSQGVGKKVENIGPYLVESGDYFVTAQKIALCGAPKMSFGNQPRDRSVGKVGFLKFVLLKSFEKRTFSNKAIIIGAHKSAKFFKTGLCQQVRDGGYFVMWLFLLISQRKRPDYGIYRRI